MLAIVIPYYKLNFFEETLQSLANQTNKEFKVYIGNDSSPQDPLPLLEKYKDQFDFEYFTFEENLGSISLVLQWKRCIDLTGSEEWLMILGDDDYLDSAAIENWYKNYNLFYKKSEVIRFATKLIVEETQTVSKVYSHSVWERATDSFYRKFEYLTRSSLSEHIFSRTAYVKYGFYDYPLAWNSDDRAWLEFSDNKPIFTINESVVFIRISTINISGKTDNFYEKDLATLEFYKFIVLKKLKFYNKQQRHRLLNKYENVVKKIRKLYLSEWFLLLFSYVKYFDWYLLKKVLKRFIKSILNYE
ncbi:glycosyltransferase family 2 protein [Flavobacterium psychrolimnae]|uniref:Glycosyltransferase family 2 protein n=1 Tax=Flavobacterium psychrolimnae TaxID=249351 RepID=A0A366B297_9FLAO|nr:glycosyltransferase family 2 protein [Flavobacterium psychrolimnae]RBN50314.1 glycosyltransferase family 2 protein [Flavobacterium psychrolimnae]